MAKDDAHKGVGVTIRFPEDLHKRLKQSAREKLPPEPFNRHVVALLYQAIKAKGREDAISQLIDDVAELKRRQFGRLWKSSTLR